MRATPEDHLLSKQRSKRPPTGGLILAGAVIVVLLAWWLWPAEETEPPAPDGGPQTPVAQQPPETPPPAPDIPRRPEPQPEPDTEPEPAEPVVSEPAPLPTPEESDELLLEALADAGVEQPAQILAGQRPLPDSAALVDALGRGRVLRPLLDVPVRGEFPVARRDGQLFMAEAGYRRYDAVAQSLAAIDTAAAAEHFHKLRPLFERAYERLGLNPEDFDNAVVRALDQVLATPVIEQPIRLEASDSVVYTYADPRLEGLTGLQKQLLRMGPDNLRRIQAQARDLRQKLLPR